MFLFTIPYATAVEIHPYFITPKHPVADDKGQHPKGPDCISSFLTELRTVAQDFASSGKVGLQVIVAPEDAVHLFCPQIEFMGDSVNLANSHESNRVSFYEFISKIEGISRGFPNTLFIPGSVVAIDEIPKELLQAADRPGFVFEQEEENFRLEEQHGQKKLVKKVGGVSVAALRGLLKFLLQLF